MTSGSSGWRIGIDAGGTFTDVMAVDDAGHVRVVKVPSTPSEPVSGRLARPYSTPRRSWSRSMLRNSAPKFPSPNDEWFLRWINSTKIGPIKFRVNICKR